MVVGSSPLTRGKPCAVWLRKFWTWAHPRSRGENIKAWALGALVAGSSPLTRGKPGQWLSMLYLLGLIPAHAGKTS